MTPGLLGLLGLLPSQVKRVYLSHSLTHSEDPHSLTQPFSHSVIARSRSGRPPGSLAGLSAHPHCAPPAANAPAPSPSLLLPPPLLLLSPKWPLLRLLLHRQQGRSCCCRCCCWLCCAWHRCWHYQQSSYPALTCSCWSWGSPPCCCPACSSEASPLLLAAAPPHPTAAVAPPAARHPPPPAACFSLGSCRRQRRLDTALRPPSTASSVGALRPSVYRCPQSHVVSGRWQHRR